MNSIWMCSFGYVMLWLFLATEAYVIDDEKHYGSLRFDKDQTRENDEINDTTREDDEISFSKEEPAEYLLVIQLTRDGKTETIDFFYKYKNEKPNSLKDVMDEVIHEMLLENVDLDHGEESLHGEELEYGVEKLLRILNSGESGDDTGEMLHSEGNEHDLGEMLHIWVNGHDSKEMLHSEGNGHGAGEMLHNDGNGHDFGEMLHSEGNGHDSKEMLHSEGNGHDAGEMLHSEGNGHDLGEMLHSEGNVHDSGEMLHSEGNGHNSGEMLHSERNGHDSGEMLHSEGNVHDSGEMLRSGGNGIDSEIVLHREKRESDRKRLYYGRSRKCNMTWHRARKALESCGAELKTKSTRNEAKRAETEGEDHVADIWAGKGETTKNDEPGTSQKEGKERDDEKVTKDNELERNKM
ncbi:filaggrin-2-like [Mercenaria mercenaria]|uniref:filaggrin-2-like n=1 Tax=Mercenaria mercenaria TaxID=6596 RepID=UPI00234F614E|nr:filaggrin-2-like [Mercenaria mercenaria]